MTAVQPARKTVLRQAIADMSYHWCPVTANLPTKMTEAGFRAACDGFYEKATLQRGPAKFQAKKYAVCLDCMGKTMPKGLEIISLDDLQTEIMEENMEATQRNDICEVCEQKKLGLKPAYGHQACSSCRILMTSVKKRPESVIKYMQEVHGDKYFSTATPVDPDHDEQWARGVIRSVRHALGIEDGEPVEDLAGRVEILVREKKAASGPVGTFAEQQQWLDRFRAEIDTLTSANNDLAAQNMELQEEADRIEKSYIALETNFGTMARKRKDLLADNAEQADIIKHLTSEKGEVVELVAEEVDMVPVARLLSDNTLLAAVNTLAGELRGAA